MNWTLWYNHGVFCSASRNSWLETVRPIFLASMAMAWRSTMSSSMVPAMAGTIRGSSPSEELRRRFSMFCRRSCAVILDPSMLARTSGEDSLMSPPPSGVKTRTMPSETMLKKNTSRYFLTFSWCFLKSLNIIAPDTKCRSLLLYVRLAEQRERRFWHVRLNFCMSEAAGRLLPPVGRNDGLIPLGICSPEEDDNPAAGVSARTTFRLISRAHSNRLEVQQPGKTS